MEIARGSRSEFSRRVPTRERVLLAALTLASCFITVIPGSAKASPMVDGPMVCFVDGNPAPSLVNPNPLIECPYGEFIRLSAGRETLDYMNRYYPDGVSGGPIMPSSIDAEAGSK